MISSHVRHNAPFIYPLAPISFLFFFLSTTFLSDPTGHLSPGPAVGKIWWWDRGGEKRKPLVHTAHKAPAASREAQQVHTFSEKPGSSLCSTFSSASPRCYTSDHQIPCRRGTRMLQLFHTSYRGCKFPTANAEVLWKQLKGCLQISVCLGDLQQPGLLFIR